MDYSNNNLQGSRSLWGMPHKDHFQSCSCTFPLGTACTCRHRSPCTPHYTSRQQMRCSLSTYKDRHVNVTFSERWSRSQRQEKTVLSCLFYLSILNTCRECCRTLIHTHVSVRTSTHKHTQTHTLWYEIRMPEYGSLTNSRFSTRIISQIRNARLVEYTYKKRESTRVLARESMVSLVAVEKNDVQ